MILKHLASKLMAAVAALCLALPAQEDESAAAPKPEEIAAQAYLYGLQQAI